MFKKFLFYISVGFVLLYLAPALISSAFARFDEWKDQNHEYVSCPEGYAYRTKWNTYVPCEGFDEYFDAEHRGERLERMEVK